MSLLNFSSPFLATPSPPTTNFYHQPLPLPLPLPQPYSYPAPQKPFLAEEYPPQQPHPFVPAGSLPQDRHQYQQHPQQQQQQHEAQQGPQGQGQQPQPLQPEQQPAYTKVNDDGTNTKVHAVIDYDYEEEDGKDGGPMPPVTPIQGPIYLKNGSVPVVPLYSHPVLNNGTFVQIPILWTALSVALGLELRGEYIRGVPCIKRHQQLFCPTAGNSYPLDRIELFIDENKALMKRMYGEFDMGPPEYRPGPGGGKRKRSTKPGTPDLHFDPGPDPGGRTTEALFNKMRSVRQNFRNNQSSESGRVDACESKVEIVTPYWASNSAGKIRAIVNTQHFEQAIHQEVCAKVRTNRCAGDCGCEQKYKWHRLLAYDPDNDCKGIFMDWFLFPSCCVCRCSPT